MFAGVRSAGDAAAAAAAHPSITPLMLDVTDEASIAAAALQVGHRDAPWALCLLHAVARGLGRRSLAVCQWRRQILVWTLTQTCAQGDSLSAMTGPGGCRYPGFRV